jgi:phosphotransferase system HPr-like phosphotransfer protein
MTTASLLVSIASALVAVAGVLLALLSEKHAKDANRIAEGALTAAREANGLSSEANQLASDANTVSKRALRVSAESIEYQWAFEIDDDGVITIRNDSAAAASDLTVVVKNENGDEIRGSQEMVPAASEVHLDGKSLVEKHFEDVANAERHISAWFGEGSFLYAGREPVTISFKCFLSWLSPAGQEHTRVLDLTLCHRVADDQGTIERLG